MISDPDFDRNAFFEDRFAKIEEGAKEAVRREVARLWREGYPIYVYRDGAVVDINDEANGFDVRTRRIEGSWNVIEGYAQIHERVRQLLKEWDPIGVTGLAPDDEYDDFIHPVVGLLLQGADERKVRKELVRIARDTIGLAMSRRDEKTMRIAAEMVAAWRKIRGNG